MSPTRHHACVQSVRPQLTLAAFACLLATPSPPPFHDWRPSFIGLLPGEDARFAALCREHRVALHDTIERQLLELAAVRHPSSTERERHGFVADALAAEGGPACCGLWVHLPWQGKVVHALGPDEYFEVVTNRNRDKITREDQHRLRSCRVGVIGLSVGGEAAVTLAQEHLCGAITLADFDRLDLSNLNRLNAGFDDLGINKAVLVARRIAKIDPYLEVDVFDEGVTEANVDAFAEGLDLIVDECDAMPMKYVIRQIARARGLNVLFAADERGFFSVEPYGQRPELPIFHGLVSAPPLPREAFPSTRDFLRALTTWMGGWDHISPESRRSLDQVGASLCGYPQLASEARFASGQIGHVARRLLLGERVPAFVGHLDLARLIPAD